MSIRVVGKQCSSAVRIERGKGQGNTSGASPHISVHGIQRHGLDVEHVRRHRLE